MNILSEDNNQLARLDYTELLKAIVASVKENKIFQWSQEGERLNLHIQRIAGLIAEKNFSSLVVNNTFAIRSATLNLTATSEKVFSEKIRELNQILSQQLETSRPGQNIKEALLQLVSHLTNFATTETPPQLGFKYNQFSQRYNLKQKRLNLQGNSKGSEAVLKLHLLTISVRNIDTFTKQLEASIRNHLTSDATLEEEEQEDLEEMLDNLINNEKSAFYDLRDRVYEETIGKLKKEAKIRYLEYLKENIEDSKDNNIIYLEDLIRRLRLLEQYLNDPNKADGDYDVSYEGGKLNYREYFARSETLDRLPIIPVVDGNLGETTEQAQGKKEFVFCLKMKLNGEVNNQLKNPASVLKYNLELLNPESEEHNKRLRDPYKSENFKRQVLQICLLYFFVFASRNKATPENSNYQAELEYDPIAKFEQHILPTLKGSDEEAKKEIFRNIITGFNTVHVETKVNRLKVLITKTLNQEKIIPHKNFSIHLGIEKSLLESPRGILEKRELLKSVFGKKSKEYLRYITVYPANVEENNLCHLPVNLTIEDLRYFSTDELQSLMAEYNLTNIKTIPVVIWNFKDDKDNVYLTYNKYFSRNKLISLYYKKDILATNESSKVFLYKFTFSLLTYLSFKLIIDQLKEEVKPLFFPIMRLQQTGGDNPAADEEFMRNFSRTLSHLLSQDILANSQGINIENLQKYRDFKIQTSLTSLYSTLPKVFQFNQQQPQLDKLAIIIISSRESDRKYDEEQVLSNLMGEIITLDREGNKVTLKNLKTFSANFAKEQMYRQPWIIIDEVNELYKKGYKHLFYIAKTPYSSNLNLTKKDEDDFFMSKVVITSLKGEKTDLKIYPIFFDKYYVKTMKPKTIRNFTAHYIKDTRELNSLVNDPSKKTVIFFNLFSGKIVGYDRFYNGVMSYATLLNVYQGVLEEQDIRDALIHDADNNQLKTDLLNYLTLVHFSRYESPANPNIKLDPYDNIIGDQSVGASSVFFHSDGKIHFNSLAFLTNVRSILNVPEK